LGQLIAKSTGLSFNRAVGGRLIRTLQLRLGLA
jgi:hypothetical protein